MSDSESKSGPFKARKYWFFLGGHDLEMITIRDLLDTHYDSQYSDAGLKWGARASNYEAEIEEKVYQGYTPVLVELEVDIEHTDGPIELIDHHGDAAGHDQPTSLEQVYIKLGMDFEGASEDQKAIAANDRGYVYELRKRGFSENKIREIREREWKIQGISDDEVSQAKDAIAHRLDEGPGLIIVNTQSDRAGLIADLLLSEFTKDLPEDHPRKDLPEPEVLVVLGPQEINIYAPGKIISELADQNFIGQWWGGALPNRGYWGISKTQITNQKLEKILSEVKDAAESHVLSAHVRLEFGGPEDNSSASFTQFILPISYSPQIYPEPGKGPYYRPLSFSHEFKSSWPAHALINERRRYFTEETGNMLYQHAAWFKLAGYQAERPSFIFQSRSTSRLIPVTFSEPRLVLFNWSSALAEGKKNSNSGSEINPLLNGFIILEIYANCSIALCEQMELNETLRHIQVPFANYYEKEQKERYSDLVSKGFPWRKIAAPSNGSDTINWQKWIDLLRFPAQDASSGLYFSIAPSHCVEEGKSVVQQDAWAGENHVFKASDTKAFVWSCAVQSKDARNVRRRLIGEFISNDPSRDIPSADHWKFGDWIKFLNIDGPGISEKNHEYHQSMLECSIYEQAWVAEPYRTYTRWAHYDTLYGYSDHSGCAFISDSEDPPFWLQWRTIYRDQALFLLYVRATLFRFSRAISSITQERLDGDFASGGKGCSEADFKARFESLRQQFVYFANLYQFPLLSTQQQGLEMYKAQREALDIDSLYREVQSQIDNAHSHSALKSQEKAVSLTTTITVLGIPLLLAGLIAALLGMDLSAHYEALTDVLYSYQNGGGLASISGSEGLYKLALWLVSILVVLLPIRLFENRLINVWRLSIPERRAYRIIGVLLWLLAIYLSICIAWYTDGLTQLAAGFLGVLVFLMAQPIRRYRAAINTLSLYRGANPRVRPGLKSRFTSNAQAFFIFIKALIGRPAETTSTVSEIQNIIKNQINRDEIERSRKRRQ